MSETQVSERPVLKAIAAIMGEVGSVEKRGRNDFHRYDYATAADIAHALQKRMADAGLIIVPNQRGMTMLDDGNVLAIEFEFMVEHVSGDRLTDRPVFTGMAAARNTKGGFDDKAANKCLTAASKYFALNLFRIPTGDYHDADGDEGAPARGNGSSMAAPVNRPTNTAPRAELRQPPAQAPQEAFKPVEFDPHAPKVAMAGKPPADAMQAFCGAFTAQTRAARTIEQLDELWSINEPILSRVQEKNPRAFDTVTEAFNARQAEVPGPLAGG